MMSATVRMTQAPTIEVSSFIYFLHSLWARADRFSLNHLIYLPRKSIVCLINFLHLELKDDNISMESFCFLIVISYSFRQIVVHFYFRVRMVLLPSDYDFSVQRTIRRASTVENMAWAKLFILSKFSKQIVIPASENR